MLRTLRIGHVLTAVCFTMTFITMGASTTSQGEPLTEDVYLGRK